MRSLIVAITATATAAIAAVACFGVAGCTVQTRPAVVDGYAVVGADTVPTNVDAYPHVWYNDRYAYLVDGRWYYPSEGGWVVFRDEPAPLYRYRQHYVYEGHVEYGHAHAAPPAVHVAPPAYGGGPHAYPPPPHR